MGTDLPPGLAEDPFDYAITKSGDVRVSRGGREIVVVRGSAARKLSARLGQSDERDQHLLARITGNYKRGNERERRR